MWYQGSSLPLLNSLLLWRVYSFKGTFWIYSLWICGRKISISSQAKALKNHMAGDIISQSDILLQEHRNITLSQWGWEYADKLSHHQKDSLALSWWVSVHLISFTQRSHEIAPFLERGENYVIVPLFLAYLVALTRCPWGWDCTNR